ncbi:MAG: ribonuclease P protein component [Clostridiales bacterium]|nr:ribonuclease P protein component [Clostridiales bacterium]
MKFTTSLKKNHEFKRVYTRGKSVASSHVVLYCLKNGYNANRLGITVGSKVGNAVIRNRVRRRLKEIYRISEDMFSKGWDLVLVSRVRAGEADFKEIRSDFLQVAAKLGLVKQPGLKKEC